MSTWTDDVIAKIVKLARDGWSASQIAEVVHRTRNAVIGKLHRLGECLKSNEGREPDVARRMRRERQRQHDQLYRYKMKQLKPKRPAEQPVRSLSAAASDTPPEVPRAEPKPPITLFDLVASSCRWPVNDGSPQFLFCDGEHIDGSPYCQKHTRMAFPVKR